MPNLWRQFEALLPNTPLLLGTLTTAHHDGSFTVELVGGGSLRATFEGDGKALEGHRVFVRDGKVTGAAPDLPSFEIEI